jgi:hypothetical protein
VPVPHSFLGRGDSRALLRRPFAAPRNLPQELRLVGVDVAQLAAHAFIVGLKLTVCRRHQADTPLGKFDGRRTAVILTPQNLRGKVSAEDLRVPSTSS